MPSGIYQRTESHLKQAREAQKKRWEGGRVTRYEIDQTTGCWIWMNAQDGNGYGHIRVNKKSLKAYRYFYEKKNGPVPEGKELDHLCKNKICVNPDHLEPVSHAVNLQRALGKYRPELIRFIRELSSFGIKGSEISRFLSIPPRTVYGFINIERWKNL